MQTSWWLDLSREQFAQRLPAEVERMETDKKRVLYSPHPGPSPDPPRRKPTAYRYHLEAGHIESI